MPAQKIDGQALAATLRAETAAAVARHLASGGRRPGLAAVIVGENPASEVYVRNKRKACEDAGMASWLHRLSADANQLQLLDLVVQLNRDPAVSGILVQLPLPKQMDETAVIRAVHPAKDVDCFHPENVGLLAAGHPRFLPCTPFGVQQMLARSGIPTAGRHVVVIGRSNIVGKPMALMLLQKNATVTICHSATAHLKAMTLQADVIVAAVGKRNVLTADMVKPGAVVLDVGMNRDDAGKLCGDVDFAGVSQVASHITPVPGGVGPMTITMLLVNTLEAAEREAARLDSAASEPK